MKFNSLPNFHWQTRPYSEQDVELVNRFLAGSLPWKDFLTHEKYIEEEPLTFILLPESVLLLGLGWVRKIPFSVEQHTGGVDQLCFLVVSSYFSSAIKTASPAEPPLTPNDNTDTLTIDLFSSTSIPPAAKKQPGDARLFSCLSPQNKSDNGILLYNSGKKRNVSSISNGVIPKDLDTPTNNVINTLMAKFPSSLFHETGDFTDLSPLNSIELTQNYWNCVDDGFANVDAPTICKIGQEVLRISETPSRSSFVFDMDTELEPKEFLLELFKKLTSVTVERMRRPTLFFQLGYIFQGLIFELDLQAHSKEFVNYANVPKASFPNIYLGLRRVAEVWGDRPLSRMDTFVLSRVIRLNPSESKLLVIAIAHMKNKYLK